jgi:hypothetical protein
VEGWGRLRRKEFEGERYGRGREQAPRCSLEGRYCRYCLGDVSGCYCLEGCCSARGVGWFATKQREMEKKDPHQRTASKLATETQESEDQGALERDPELSMLLVLNALPVVRCLVDGGCQSSQLLRFACIISSTGASLSMFFCRKSSE